MLSLIVCGGRDYTDKAWVFCVLDYVHREIPIDMLIHGDARGADALAREWAEARDVPTMPFPPDWDSYGKRAGLLRNGDMLEYLLQQKHRAVLAFPGGRGTDDMTRQASEAGVEVIYA